MCFITRSSSKKKPTNVNPANSTTVKKDIANTAEKKGATKATNIKDAIDTTKKKNTNNNTRNKSKTTSNVAKKQGTPNKNSNKKAQAQPPKKKKKSPAKYIPSVNLNMLKKLEGTTTSSFTDLANTVILIDGIPFSSSSIKLTSGRKNDFLRLLSHYATIEVADDGKRKYYVKKVFDIN